MSEIVGPDLAARFTLKDLGSTPDYAEYVDCFDRGRFYEAHDALEPLWLRIRNRRDGLFLKGLIQLAGAFVHIQKGRIGPARALLGRARFHLEPFLDEESPVNLPAALELIGQWDVRLSVDTPGRAFLAEFAAPQVPRNVEDRPLRRKACATIRGG